MSYIVDNWSFDPLLVVGVVAVALHELGLRRLARDAAPSRTRRRRRRAYVFYAGVALVVLALCSPMEYWSYDYFFVHMLEHILLMFFAPILIVAGAPWAPLLHALPTGTRRRLGRAVSLSPAWAPLRGAWRAASTPWVALVAFNALMVWWHLPGPFDFAQRSFEAELWLMYGSYLVFGVLFWLQIVPSRPFRRRASAVWQIGAIVSTNFVMFVLAMALSILTNHSWYSVYAARPGVSLSPFADQQIGAAILWVCGDFWAVPSLVAVVKRAIEEEGSLSQVLDAMIGRSIGGWGRVSPTGSDRPT
ncbi:MAG: cytochrome c oxidase assembly protein [Acidimicrobiales bacterium]